MKLNRIGSFIVLGLALMLILSQSASVAVKAQVGGNFSASLSQQTKIQNPKSKIQNPTDQAPYKITVQGRLTDPSGNPITNAVNVSFNLYSVPTGGSPIFSEGPVSVTPDNRGLLTYQLGSTSVISTALVSQFANTLYLGLTVGSDAEMAPRILLTASPYAMSLAPGTVVQGAYDSSVYTTNFGVINGVNLDGSSVNNAGLYGKGATGVYGEADPSRGFGAYAGYFTNPGGYGSSQFGIYAQNNSTGGSEGYGGYFYNSGGGSGKQYGVYAYAGASSDINQTSIGVVGVSNVNPNGLGGVFTGTLTGAAFYATDGGPNAVGAISALGAYGPGMSPGRAIKAVGGSSNSNNGAEGLYAQGGDTTTGSGYGGNAITAVGGADTASSGGDGIAAYSGAGDPAAQSFAGYFNTPANVVSVYATGEMNAIAYFTHSGYGMMVQYHGSEPLHAGDVLALDGDNRTVHGDTLLGVVKATASNAALAVGVVQQRFTWQQRPTFKASNGRTLDTSGWQNDTTSSTFGQNDVLGLTTLGQVRMKVGKASFGDELTLDPTGNLTVADTTSRHIVGTVASQPDKDGYITVFVNLK